jgi:hypothetical protein
MSLARAVALKGRGCPEIETRKVVIDWAKGSAIVGGSLRFKASVTERSIKYCLFDHTMAFTIKLRKIKENL